MIRAPLTLDEALSWWREAVAVPEYERRSTPIPDEPQAGFFKRKLCKGGPFVPARIWLDQTVGDDGELLDAVLRCAVDGDEADPFDQWSYVAGNPITEAEFDYLTARNAWAIRYAPNDPAARPREPINHLSSPIQF